MLPNLLVILVAYLIGSIPFGYLIVRAVEGADVRETGSRGTGATNVSRRAGKLAGVVTLLLDAAKGSAAILIARWLLGVPPFETTFWITVAAIAVVVGHIFPLWLGFRGGKGVATGVGVFLVVAPFTVLGAGLIFLAIVLLTRYVSLASIFAAGSIPLFVGLFYRSNDRRPLLYCALAGATLIVFAHRGNIRRLLKGTERKFK